MTEHKTASANAPIVAEVHQTVPALEAQSVGGVAAASGITPTSHSQQELHDPGMGYRNPRRGPVPWQQAGEFQCSPPLVRRGLSVPSRTTPPGAGPVGYPPGAEKWELPPGVEPEMAPTLAVKFVGA